MVGYPSDNWASCNLVACRQPIHSLSTAAADSTFVLNCMKTDFTADICAALLATDLDLPL